MRTHYDGIVNSLNEELDRKNAMIDENSLKIAEMEDSVVRSEEAHRT